MTPDVSIVMPTFNRADSLPRAISSVLEQSYGDWELIIVDDGSTDGTRDLIESYQDQRIVYHRQENQGCYVARNAGLARAKGSYLTFLDSDDEWLPHYLLITTAFLRNSPDDQIVLTEFKAHYGEGTFVLDLHDIEHCFTENARIVGSSMLDLPDDISDPYLRVYDEKLPLRDFLSDIEVPVGCQHAQVYRGHIYEYFRWGYLGWLPTTMMTRAAYDTVGEFPSNYVTAADYRYLAALSKHFRANMIATPCAVKHELGPQGSPLNESHLATGEHEYRYATKRIALFLELFGDRQCVELTRIAGLNHRYAGAVAVRLGNLADARQHFTEAIRCGLDRTEFKMLDRLSRWAPNGTIAAAVYRVMRKMRRI